MQPLGKLAVCKGLNRNQVRQLIKFTNTDPLIAETTRDLERFKDIKTYRLWLTKKRTIYALIDKNKNLMGIIWFGIKQMPKNINFSEKLNANHYSVTFAIRLYEGARGKSLSKKFITNTWELYSNSKEFLENPNKGLWLETNINNFAAVSSYKNLGFKLVSKPDKKGNVIMLQL